ncbi:fumarylacetoacetate hydrolase family protein [Halodurantibacterium flavum]|uniref:Fumarylacetoacetate hydrolase family protein n=1 Tax=Halodurantibacterium flavum TaxID=1382802 RepID=A0ABW4SA29_9RHOB
MKLARIGAPGAEVPALLGPDGRYRSLVGHVADIAGEALSDAALVRIAALDPEKLPVLPEGRIGPCVGAVGKFICIGLNYADHAAEAGMPIPTEPVIFMKATSAICGPNDQILIPRGSAKTDWEVELGIVIGKAGVYIEAADAMDHIAGYCVVHDLSEREFQNERGGTWDKGKGCDTFGPIGPWLVTRDEIADPRALRLWLEVDGERMQDGSTATMIFDLPTIVSYVSQFMSLQPGDVITTGTPPGVGMGRTPPRFLRGGEVVTLGIEGLGEQRQSVGRA